MASSSTDFTNHCHQKLEDIFEHLNQVLTAQDQTRENIRTIRDQADVKVRTTQRSLATLHTASGDVASAASQVVPLLAPMGEAIAAVEGVCPDEPGSFYQYHDIWRNVLQQAVYICVVLEFIRCDKLAGPDRVLQMLGSNLRLPLEDYLWGVCHAVSELPRFAMNRVTVGDYLTPRRCAVFGANVFEAFKQLNFRNDFLRKKYDGMKYDVKRIEEIMYDLSIRGLLRDDTPCSDRKDPGTEQAATEPH